MSIPIQPPADYGRLAKCYSFLEYLVFARQLQRCRQACWQELGSLQEVLLLGDGNGRFSTFLLKKIPSIRVAILDSSLAMLTTAKKRRVRNNISEDRLTIIHEDVMSWQPEPNKYDAVVAQFFFDSFLEGELSLLTKKIQTALRPTGKLLVSEFHTPSDTRLGKWRSRVTLKILYALFGILTGLQTKSLGAHKPLLLAQNFILKNEIYFSQKTLVSQTFEIP